MKLSAIFCVLALVCACALGIAEAAGPGKEVIDRLTKALKDQVAAESTNLDRLVRQTVRKLATAVADAKNSGNTDLEDCLVKARDYLQQTIVKYNEELNKCSNDSMSDLDSWNSKSSIDSFVNTISLRASVCNKEQTRIQRRSVIKVNSTANKYCRYWQLIPDQTDSQ